MLALVLAALVSAMVAAIRLRGPWYDEFYTLYVTRPGVPLPYAFSRWLADNHPPLFYALARATSWLGATVEERRWVNLFVLLAATVQLAWWLIPHPLRRLGWVFAVTLASAWPAIDRAAELRSNYLAFASAAVAVAALIAFDRGHRADRRAAWAMLTFALLIAFNVHLAASIVVGSLAAAMILRRLLARDRQGAFHLFAAAALAAVPMLVHLLWSFGQIEANTRSFWIPGGLDAARWAIEIEVLGSLTANPAVTVLAAIGFAMLAWRSWCDRRLAAPADLALTLAVGLGIAVILMVAIHLWRPFIIGRYLVTLHPPIAMILALGVTALLDRARPVVVVLLSAAMTLAAMVAVRENWARTVAQPSWYGTGSAIAAIQRACPTARIHVHAAGNSIAMAAPPVENRVVFPFAYRIVAAHFGFPIVSGYDMGRDCPTLFWTEHAAGQPVTVDGLMAELRARGFPIGRARLRRIGYGYVLEAWPTTTGALPNAVPAATRRL